MADKKVTTKRKPTAKDWDRIRALYLRAESLDDILNALPDVELSKHTIQCRMSKEGFAAKKRAMEERVMDLLVSTAEKEKISVNETCIKLFNDGSRVISELLSQYIDEVQYGNTDKNKARATAYNIDMLMSGVTKIQKGLRVAYGMDDNGKLYEKEPEVLVIDGLNPGKI